MGSSCRRRGFTARVDGPESALGRRARRWAIRLMAAQVVRDPPVYETSRCHDLSLTNFAEKGVRHEALRNRVEVKDLLRRAVAAVW